MKAEGSGGVVVRSVRRDARPLRDEVLRVADLAMDEAGLLDSIPAGRGVAVKPNLGFDHFLPGAVTGPWVLEAVLAKLRGAHIDVVVVEADQVVVDIQRAAKLAGALEVCRRLETPFINLSRQPFEVVELPGAEALRKVPLPRILRERALVTVPVLKTHNKTRISGALKNQWGCLPTLRHNFHPVLDAALVDLARLLPPTFCVVDGTVGLEGDGPKSGRPREFDCVVAGADPVAVDATLARILGFEPRDIPHLAKAAAVGVGSLCTDVRPGSRVVEARHNPVSFLELQLRDSRLRRLAFDTPLFSLLCFGARRWYDLWYQTIGRRRAQQILDGPYGQQWRS